MVQPSEAHQMDRLGDDKDQCRNDAGGFVWKVTDMNRLARFLCMGSEGGTYYIKDDRVLGRENAASILRLIESGRGVEVVEEIKKFSVEGRAAKQSPTIFALVLCAQSSDLKTKQAAYKALGDVCRIPTHLFNFVDIAEGMAQADRKTSGWGRSQRKAVSKWYNEKDPMKLAMAVTKYKQRNGWSHIDLLRLAHVKPSNKITAAILKYAIKGFEAFQNDAISIEETEDADEIRSITKFLNAVNTVKHSTDEQQASRLVEEHRLVWEHLPTGLLNSREVWTALLQHMPMTAMIRNLGKMTAIGLLDPDNHNSAQTQKVLDRLNNIDALHASRIHPFNVLLAMKTYEQGKGEKGKLRWQPNQNIILALNKAFYSTFKNVEPTNKRHLLAMDVSGSMSYGAVNGSPQINPAMAAAAMALVVAHTEPDYDMVAFSTEIEHMPLSADMLLPEVCQAMGKLPIGGTDCAAPIKWALEKKKAVDVFVVYTDSETWVGAIHPAEALRQYRSLMKIPDARLIVCGMTSNGFTLADPEDPGMLDMAGFDSNAPTIMHSFIKGLL